MGDLDYFWHAIEIQLLYSVIITLLMYSVPAADQTYLLHIGQASAASNPHQIANKFQDSLTRQQSFGVVDVAGLALYSGNLLIDLILNFFTAIPSMVTIVIKGIFLFIHVDPVVQTNIEVFAFSLLSIIYIISILSLLLSVRTGRQVSIG